VPPHLRQQVLHHREGGQPVEEGPGRLEKVPQGQRILDLKNLVQQLLMAAAVNYLNVLMMKMFGHIP
jgi:hypothetical protein